jgi:SAM-dependent methyltransferase
MTTGPVSDTWERGSPYEQYIGRWSRRIAPLFLTWLQQPAGARWLDVGCGTGALCTAILNDCAPQAVIGVEPSDGFRATAARNTGDRARFLAGDAASIPLADASCDVVVSGLVLNFVPELGAALAELGRVTAPGGTVAAYVWDYAGRMAITKSFWDAAVALDPAAQALDEALRFPLCHPAALEAALTQAGFADVESGALEVTAEFSDFDDYWQPFLGGQGPAPSYAMSLDESRRAALRARLEAGLAPDGDGAIRMPARAWAVRGIRPFTGRSPRSRLPSSIPRPGSR